MKSFIYIDFAVPSWSRDAIYTLFQSAGLAANDASITDLHSYYGIRLRADDPRIDLLTARLNSEGIGFNTRREIKYEWSDLEAAPFVCLIVRSVPKGDAKPFKYTEYEMTAACRECGTGALQVSVLRLSSKKLPKKKTVSETRTGQIVLNSRLALALIEELGTDSRLRQIKDQSTNEQLPWWQMLPDRQMPPFALETKGVIRDEKMSCKVCDRDGYFHRVAIPFQPAYQMSEDQITKLPDIIWTYEHFGKSRLGNEPGTKLGFAQPLILLSNKVARVFLREKVRGIELIPVRFL